MTEFHPPMSQRETMELIEIANCYNENIWTKEARIQASKELTIRNVTRNEQDEVLQAWKEEREESIRQEKERLKRNETESYHVWEMVILFIFGPFLFVKPHYFNTHTLFSLRRENFKLKFKQRAIIFVLSFSAWYFYLVFFGF